MVLPINGGQVTIALDERPSLRQRVAALMQHRYTDSFMNLAICVNVLVMVREVDHNAKCVGVEDEESCQSLVLRIVSILFLAVYTVELSLKLFAFRGAYFASRLNIIDMFVVVVGLGNLVLEEMDTMAIPSFQMLRVVRIFRLIKTVRVLENFPELVRLIRGFMSATIAMFWGLTLICLLLVSFSIISVELIHPKNQELFRKQAWDLDDWCAEAFSSVWTMSIFYFQTLVAGDSWGQCIIPIIREYPWFSGVFVSALAFVQLGFTNLILAVVVDSAAAARDADREARLAEKKDRERKAVSQLDAVIRSCDADNSGEVTLEEMTNAYENEPEVDKIFEILDIDREDLEEFFYLMDTDGNGTLSYQEFVKSLKKAEMQDFRVQVMLLRLQVARIMQDLSQQKLDKKHRRSVEFAKPAHGHFSRKDRRFHADPPSESSSDIQYQVFNRSNELHEEMADLTKNVQQAMHKLETLLVDVRGLEEEQRRSWRNSSSRVSYASAAPIQSTGAFPSTPRLKEQAEGELPFLISTIEKLPDKLPDTIGASDSTEETCI